MGDLSQSTVESVADMYIPLSCIDDALKSQLFVKWLGIVYFNRIPPPAGPDKDFPAAEDPITVLDFHDDYEAGAWRKLGRGLTMEESWFCLERALGEQFMWAVNSEAPLQPMERIERKIVLDGAATIESAIGYLGQQIGARRRPLAALVTDGALGHCISLVHADPAGDRFVFFDSRPGRSLLCEENNAAGVKACSLGQSKLDASDGQTVDVES